MTITKDTTPILKHQEDVDLEAGDVFPHLLVLRPHPASYHHQHKRPPSSSPAPETTFRLRMVCLITIASLALMTIVLISQQLISRHLANQRIVEDHVVLEVEMPDFGEAEMLDRMRENGEVHNTEMEVEMEHGIPGQQPHDTEIQVFQEDGVEVVKETNLDLAQEDNFLQDHELEVQVEDEDVDLDNVGHDTHDQLDIDHDLSGEDEYYYDDDYDEDYIEDDYDEDDYEDDHYDDDYDGLYNDSFEAAADPKVYLNALQGEDVKKIEKDQIEQLKAVLNAHNGEVNSEVW